MNLLKTKPGIIINLDQIRLIEVQPDRFLFHFVGGLSHEVPKKYLAEGEEERIDKAIRAAIAE